MFTALKLPVDQITAEAARIAQGITAMSELAQPLAFAAQVVRTRLREHPARYLEFGPYWWSVKSALRDAGAELGTTDNPLVRADYGGDLPAFEAIVAGEMFKDAYRRHYLAGTSQFWLDEEAQESYVLFDADMEAQRTGRAALLAALDLAPMQLADEPEKPEPGYRLPR